MVHSVKPQDSIPGTVVCVGGTFTDVGVSGVTKTGTAVTVGSTGVMVGVTVAHPALFQHLQLSDLVTLGLGKDDGIGVQRVDVSRV